jgi:hypothetical protein
MAVFSALWVLDDISAHSILSDSGAYRQAKFGGKETYNFNANSGSAWRDFRSGKQIP